MQKAHGAHPAARVHEHPLQFLVGQHVAWVQPPQLHDEPREGKLVVQPWQGQRSISASTGPGLGNDAPESPSSARVFPALHPFVRSLTRVLPRQLRDLFVLEDEALRAQPEPDNLS